MKKANKPQKKNVNVKSKAPTEKDYTNGIVDSLMNRQSNTQHNEFSDSTSMVQLNVMKEDIAPVITNEFKVSDEIDSILELIEDSPESNPENLDNQVNILKEAYFSVTNSEKAITAIFTAQHIKIGKLSIGIKRNVVAQGYRWEKWADKNLNFMGKRIRQNNMQLAQIPNVEQYLMFGKERLLHIWQVIKGIVKNDDLDPIGTFLQKHNIDFETALELPLAEFKSMVDTAVVIEKASSHELDLDRKSVRGLIEIGFKFTNADFQQFKSNDGSGGDPNVSLEKLLINKGLRDKVYDKHEKKKASFIRTTAQMKELVDHMIENKEFDEIDPNEITDLIKKLDDFRKKLIKQ